MEYAPKKTNLGRRANFIYEKQLLARLPISRRTLFNWRTTGKFPVCGWAGVASCFTGRASKPRCYVTSIRRHDNSSD